MATNRIDSLDPALIRPGRIDRKIEFPLPDEKTRRMIFKIHTGRMTLATDVNLEELIMAKDDLSGADIKVSSIMFLFENEIFLLGNLYGIRFNGITRTSNESDK
jgi:ATP-dependent 26S proteasome regulatory subunit